MAAQFGVILAVVVNEVRIALAGLGGHTTFRGAAPNPVMRRAYYYPGWVPVIAFLLFPIGLVAVVPKRTADAAIVAEYYGPMRTRLRLRGRFDTRAIARINEIIGARTQPNTTGTVTPVGSPAAIAAGESGVPRFAPGWSPDSSQPEHVRWWDGTQWSDHRSAPER